MTMNPNTTIDRKELAKELAQETGAEVKYLGVPSCAYRVGPYTINKDASIAGDDFEAIRDFLIRHDYIHQEPAIPAEASEDDDEPSSDFNENETSETNASVSISDLNAVSLVNLIKLVYAKQNLINAMTQSDFMRTLFPHVQRPALDSNRIWWAALPSPAPRRPAWRSECG